ncbi:YitT family protein [Atopobium deltae]|uniref:YitT family protein n=1 Tax=Atopobium deltae TaxID=1393034 RepID=UPI000A7173C3|nr:YitT family protein [Atopobium deltae]
MNRHIIHRGDIRDAMLIVVGSLIFAVGIDCFQVPNGLAAGGITGLATIIHAVGEQLHLEIPIGAQTLFANVFLLIPVIKSGGKRYLVRTIAGILCSSIALDLLAPWLPALGKNDLLLASIWGGVITGFGLGLVFRSGGNTGGTDIIAQLIARHSSFSVGTASIIIDAIVIVMSIPVFSLSNALYAVICMFITGRVLDFVIDGPSTTRVAYIISEKHERIANAIMYEMKRGCTEIQARGVWSGNRKPMLFVVLSRGEINYLKSIVESIDFEAVVVISEVHEAFGEGFSQLGVK